VGDQRIVFVCQGTGCVSSASEAVYEAFKDETDRQGMNDVEVDFTGCHGFCEQGPNVVIEPQGVFYTHVQAEDAAEIVTSHLRDGKPVERLFYHDPMTGQAIPQYSEINFYKKQQRVVLRNCGQINPEKIDHYIARGGYRALRKAFFEMTPEQVISEVTNSGLRGRGGAGFPTGRKWEFCRNSMGQKKYVICNADEGDPGAFMDRSILEADPHAVIEGLTIAGYAIGADEGYIYVRAEYPLAVRRVHTALEQAVERGFTGKDIVASGFDFTIHVKEGAGAFVCGEETALMASIESRRGMPRPRPPFPAQSGLGGMPTNINNVKTVASIPVIIDQGADWFAGIGTEKSKGTGEEQRDGGFCHHGEDRQQWAGGGAYGNAIVHHHI
jgi:NADH-quinone oxidoreductase subunit F/NADP-reducing hydrogenase subunit HndC